MIRIARQMEQTQAEQAPPDGGLAPIDGANVFYSVQNTNIHDEKVADQSCWDKETVAKRLTLIDPSKRFHGEGLVRLLSHLCVKLDKTQLRKFTSIVRGIDITENICSATPVTGDANPFGNIDTIR